MSNHATTHAAGGSDELTFQCAFQYAGVLYLGDGFGVSLYHKPRLLHRIMMRLLLGWRWEDTTYTLCPTQRGTNHGD